MGKTIVGSIRKVTLNGVTYNAAADADVPQVAGNYANEGIATTGGTVRKMTVRVQEVDVDLVTSGAEFDALKSLSEKLDDITMSYVTAAGDIYRAKGFINLDKRQTQEGKTSIKMIPRGAWDSFLN